MSTIINDEELIRFEFRIKLKFDDLFKRKFLKNDKNYLDKILCFYLYIMCNDIIIVFQTHKTLKHKMKMFINRNYTTEIMRNTYSLNYYKLKNSFLKI